MGGGRVGVDEVEELPLLTFGDTHQFAAAGLPDGWAGGDVLGAGMDVAVEALDGAMTKGRRSTGEVDEAGDLVQGPGDVGECQADQRVLADGDTVAGVEAL